MKVRYCHGIKMVRNDETDVWEGYVLGRKITAYKYLNLWYTDVSFCIELKTLKSAVYHVIRNTVINHFEEIVNKGWKGIAVKKINAKTTLVMWKGEIVGVHNTDITAEKITDDIVDGGCLA